jgi:AAT family amino acid transporter
MAYFPDTRVALIIGPLWLVLLTALFYALGLNNGFADETLNTAARR